MYQDLINISLVRKKILTGPKKLKFCAALISNNFSTDGFRFKFINELNKYKKVDMGGKAYNNIGRIIDKKMEREFFSEYKFSISMENSEGDGYVSEKIVNSFNSGTIPIYYGDYLVDEYINPNSYILIKGEKDINEKLEYIKKIDNNDKLYERIINEKVLLDKHIQKVIRKEYNDFIFHIFDQEKSKAFRK